MSVALQSKQTLLLRPLQLLLDQPHILSGWLSANKHRFDVSGKKTKDQTISWLDNPLRILVDLYRFLNMEHSEGRAAANMVWDHDHGLLEEGLSFYDDLRAKMKLNSYGEVLDLLDQSTKPKALSKTIWQQVQASHAGFQAGMDLLKLMPYLALSTGFFDLNVKPDLSIQIPSRLQDAELQDTMRLVLVPPPVASSNEILALSGGMFYAREAPGMPEFVQVGDHFKEGDPLYIVEVMKMFNKVYAPFDGTVERVLVEGDGVIISKGQPLFNIKPDVSIVQESPADIKARKTKAANQFIAIL